MEKQNVIVRWLCRVLFLALSFAIGTLQAQKPYVVKSGANYLTRLKTDGVWSIATTTTFSESCVWYSSNVHNYYFVDPVDGVRYYLYALFQSEPTHNGDLASSSAYGAGVPLQLVAESSLPDGALSADGRVSGSAYFYDWDHGLAHGQEYMLGGEESCPSQYHSAGGECWRCYWLVYDDATTPGTPAWHMSTAATYDPVASYASFQPARVTVNDVSRIYSSGGLTALAGATLAAQGATLDVASLATLTAYNDNVTPGFTAYAVGALSNCRGDWTIRVCDTTWDIYLFYDGVYHHYDPAHPSRSMPADEQHHYTTADDISFRWSLSGVGAGHLSFASDAQLLDYTAAPNAASPVPQPTLYYRTANTDADKTATLTLTVTYPDGTTQSRHSSLTVKHFLPPPTAISVADVTLVEGGGTATLQVGYTPSGAVNTEVTVSSSNTSVVTVDGLVVTPVAVGTATLTATSQADLAVSASATVTVRPVSPSINHTPSGAKMAVTVASGSGCTGGQLQYKVGGGSWTDYSAPFTVDNGVTVTARYKCNGVTSDEVSYVADVPSGIRGDFVVLNDCEPHSWSYYSDPQCPIRSLNPMDVKITYYGNGSGDGSDDRPYNMTTTDNSDRPTSFGANATGVRVGVVDGETQNTFVYYKTLERNGGDVATSVAASTGDAPYTTIPNPFQVRPTYTSSSSRYRGFYAWRVKSMSPGLTIKNAATLTTTYGVNAIIPAETDLLFGSSSEYGNEVEFEALWAKAYVTTSTSEDMSPCVAASVTSACERNFHVVTGQNQKLSNYQKSYPLTISAYYPDGTPGAATLGTLDTGKFAAAADTKFENINLGIFISSKNENGHDTSRIVANGHNLTIGRNVTGRVFIIEGLHKTGDEGEYKFKTKVENGVTQSETTSTGYLVGTNVNYRIRVESGTYDHISFYTGYKKLDGTYYGSGLYNTSFISGANNYVEGILGCDYDRASGNNDKLNVVNNIAMGTACKLGEQNVNNKTLDVTVKSGKLLTAFLGPDTMGSGDIHQSIYLSIGNAGSIFCKKGRRSLTVEGGVIANIGGGVDESNQYKNNNHVRSVTFRMKGGQVKGAIYGGAGTSAASGDRYMVITGGTVRGWVGCGCNGVVGSSNVGGQTYGHGSLYVGGNAVIGEAGTDININGGVGGTVFGAGKGSGDDDDTQSGEMTYGTTVVIADNCSIKNDVYGGGNYGYAKVSTDLHILGGTVGGKVFGGSNENGGPNITITQRGGWVKGGLYGGSNDKGTVTGNVVMSVVGGTVGVDADNTANIRGGGYGLNTSVTGNVDVIIGHRDSAATQPTIFGDVYGGGALGSVNGTVYDAGKHTRVTVNQGLLLGNNAATGNGTGSVYGGGLGETLNGENHPSQVFGDVVVTINGGTMNNIFGCNNINGMPQGKVTIIVNGGTISTVYGCGNNAEYGTATNNVTPVVRILGGTVRNVYGGGRGAGATVYKPTKVVVGGRAHILENVFGGGNGAPVNTDPNPEPPDPSVISTVVRILGSASIDGNVYGGGNKAKVTGSTDIRIGGVE